MAEIRWQHLMIRVPRGWKAQSRDGGILLCPTDAPATGDPIDAVDIGSLERPNGANSLEVAAAQLMASRVLQGHPEFSLSTFAGAPALRYAWTDGVQHVASWFFRLDGEFYEVQLRVPLFGSHEEYAREARSLCDDGVRLSHDA